MYLLLDFYGMNFFFFFSFFFYSTVGFNIFACEDLHNEDVDAHIREYV